MVEPKTRIGSPFVIAGMVLARAKGRQVVCGWEANGGILLGYDLQRWGRTLRALPMRDALLSILGVLFAAEGRPLPEMFARLPQRYSKAALLKNFPRPVSQRIIAHYAAASRFAPFFK